jgi:hypothetical protein
LSFANSAAEEKPLSVAAASLVIPAQAEEGLRLMVRLRKQARALKSLKGLGWEGDLDEMRQDRLSRPS